MKIAVTYDRNSDKIHEHFDDTKHFKFYDIENYGVLCSEIIAAMESECDMLVGLLAMFEADGVLCGSLSSEAARLLDEEGIQYFIGCTGNPDNAVEALLRGDLHSTYHK